MYYLIYKMAAIQKQAIIIVDILTEQVRMGMYTCPSILEFEFVKRGYGTKEDFEEAYAYAYQRGMIASKRELVA